MTRIPWTWGFKITDQFRRDLLMMLAEQFRGRVLDVGCGRKPYREILGRHAQRWIGVDLPQTCAGPPSADVYGDGQWLPFRNGAFDIVLSTEVLEHVREPKQLFAEMARVLRPGGRLVLTAPQTMHLHEEPHDYFRYTKYGLAYLAQQNGFRVVDVRSFGGALALIGQNITYHIPVVVKNRAGEWLRGIGQAMVQWVFWHADRVLHRFHDGAEESTIGNLLVAEKMSESGATFPAPSSDRMKAGQAGTA